MAAAVFTRTPAPYLNRLENFDTPTLFRLGQTAGSDLNITDAERVLGHTPASAARQCLEMALRGYHTLEYAMSTDSTTAGVINLSTGALVDFLTVGKSRRVSFEVYIKADVDCGWIQGESLVACAATPIVANLPVSINDAGGGAAETIRTNAGVGDITEAILVAGAVLSVSSTSVILTLTGPTMNCRWVIKVKIHPCVSHPLIAS